MSKCVTETPATGCSPVRGPKMRPKFRNPAIVKLFIPNPNLCNSLAGVIYNVIAWLTL